ncbi:hypothetical protein BH23GEM6_BH23GEM6_11830 [soil metagenome]
MCSVGATHDVSIHPSVYSIAAVTKGAFIHVQKVNPANSAVRQRCVEGGTSIAQKSCDHHMSENFLEDDRSPKSFVIRTPYP